MDYQETAKKIVELVGGKDNISNMTHCATRLRFNLKNRDIVKHEAVENLEGIVSVVEKAGQYQIVIGLNVDKVYGQVEKIVKIDQSIKDTNTTCHKQGIVSSIFSAISSIFAPLLPALAGSGILRGLTLLSVQLGILDESSGTYAILTVASMSVFYFLPILLAFTSALKFGTNPYISALIGASLLNPDFVALMGEYGNGAMTDFFGIPAILMKYNSTVIPIIFSIWIYSFLSRFLERYIPEGMKLVFIPLISLLVMVPLTIIAIGPIGVYGGEFIAYLVNSLIISSGLLSGVVVGGGWSVLVSFGMHWAVNPIMINNISTLGYDFIVPLTFACNFAVAGTGIGVFLKVKNKKMKNFSLTGAITIALSGIIEPLLYGILIRNKKLFLIQIIGGAIGGAFLGMMKVASNAFVFGGMTTIPAFISEDSNNFISAIIGLTISFVISALLAYIFTNKDEKMA